MQALTMCMRRSSLSRWISEEYCIAVIKEYSMNY